MNHIKTVMFLALLIALLVWLGQELAGQVALLVALMVLEIMKFDAYRWLDKLSSRRYGAQEAQEAQACALCAIVA